MVTPRKAGIRFRKVGHVDAAGTMTPLVRLPRGVALVVVTVEQDFLKVQVAEARTVGLAAFLAIQVTALKAEMHSLETFVVDLPFALAGCDPRLEAFFAIVETGARLGRLGRLDAASAKTLVPSLFSFSTVFAFAGEQTFLEIEIADASAELLACLCETTYLATLEGEMRAFGADRVEIASKSPLAIRTPSGPMVSAGSGSPAAVSRLSPEQLSSVRT